ncbi:hypothetical protein R6Q59_036147 [Mikania micrantha]
MSALGNELTFGWKHALSQEHEADFENSKKRAFNRPNEGGNTREYTDNAMEIFEACGYHPEIGIKVLRQKTLITIVYKELYGNVFDMHDLVEEMGHYFVRGEHPMNPRKHSRVWKREEIKEMCFKDATMENDMIEALRYFLYPSEDNDLSSRFC